MKYSDALVSFVLIGSVVIAGVLASIAGLS